MVPSMKTISPDKYSIDYSKPAPALASSAGDFLLRVSSLERARRNLAREAERKDAPPKSAPPPPKPIPRPEPPQEDEPPKARRTVKKRSKPKRPPVIIAIISGLLVSAIILLAATGLYGTYCFSRGLPGDVNVYASTAMYCLAVFCGSFWAGAVVKRQSLVPVYVIGGAYLVTSIAVSLHLFGLAEFKFTMLLFKIVLTAAAALLGFALSLIPYLINRAIKRQRQKERERRLRRKAQY